MLKAGWQLRRLLLRQRPSLVHADGVKAALVAVIACAGTRIPVTWFKVDFSHDGWLARAIALRCRQIVGISHAVTKTFGPLLRQRVRVVPCGIPNYALDRTVGRALVLKLLRCPTDASVVAHLGRLHPRKGQLELLEAAPVVLERQPNTRFLLLPPESENDLEREYEAELRSRVRELQIEHAVALVPGRDDPVQLMSGCDAVAVPSIPDVVSGWREGFGLVGAEAMAVGTPVVGYADGALPETLGDCGLLVPTGDRAALGSAIVRVLTDEVLRTQMVNCGTERAKRYRLESTVEQMKGCYREAVVAP